MKHPLRSAALGLLALAALRASADVPHTIAFQGVMRDAAGKPMTSPAAGTSVTFSLYANQNDTTPAWAETQTVNAKDGVFAAPLGSVRTFASAGVVFDKPYWVGVKVGADAEMSPRLPFQSVPYALAVPGITAGPNPNGFLNIGQGGSIILNLSENGANVRGSGQLLFGGNGRSDDVMYIEGFSSNGLSSLSELWVTGRYGDPLPRMYVRAGESDFDGEVRVSGGVGIGTTSPEAGYKLDVVGSAIFRGSDLCLRGNGGGAGNNNHLGRALVDLGPSGGLMVNYANDFGQVQISGPVSIGTLTLTSSRRYKRDVQPIQNALGLLSRLQGVTYSWDAEHGGQPDLGFIAEDVGHVLPQLVAWEPNGRDAKGMDYSHLVALTVEGIKEQQRQMADQHKRIVDVEAENAALKARLDRLEAIVEAGGRK